MRNRRVRLLVLALFTVCLPGCFDLVEELWINPDGSGKARMEIILPPGPLSLLPGQTREQASQQIMEGASRSGQDLLREGKVKSVSFNHVTEQGADHFLYDVEVVKAEQLDEVMNEVLAGAAAFSGSGERRPWSFRLEKVGKDELRFTQRLEGGASDGDAGTPSEPLAAFVQGMVASAWNGRTFTVRIHAPRASDTNGAWDSKGEAVEWRMDLAKLMTGQQPATELHASLFTTRYPMALLIGGGVGIVVAVGLLASVLSRRRR